MILASLILNIAVLIPVCFALLLNKKEMEVVAGVFTPARGVLLAIYTTILLASVALLLFDQPTLAFGLFLMQIVYKYLTPFTVKTVKNPIVISNLFIATFHVVTVITSFKSGIITFE